MDDIDDELKWEGEGIDSVRTAEPWHGVHLRDGCGNKPPDSDCRGVGPEALLGAVAEDAITDCKALMAAGVIVRGRCVRQWPRDAKGHRKVFLNDYDSPSPVNELIDFMTKGNYGRWLKMLGSPITVKMTLEGIGLKTKQVA